MESLRKVFDKIAAIDYVQREGGRYAYVQLMAYLRDLKNELSSAGIYEQEQKRLGADGDLLNEMVHLRFEAAHRLVFDGTMKELEEMRRRIFSGREKEIKN
jgi:hypothetical protein